MILLYIAISVQLAYIMIYSIQSVHRMRIVAILLFCIICQYSKVLYSQNVADPELGFGSGTFNAPVQVTALQADGKVIVGGNFTRYKNISVNHIARLNTDGTLDNSFTIGTGADGIVYSIAIQTDGKIIIGGEFINYNGVSVPRVARLNSNGTLDNSFSVGTGANNTIYSIVILTSGKILVGGDFTTYNGTSINRFLRLQSDGSRDNSFTVGTGANGSIRTITAQTDGKAIIGGDFTTYSGTTLNRIARVNVDGSVDVTFTVGTGADFTVNTSCVQSDGKIIIAGSFYTYNGTSRNRIIRLEAYGAVDNTFTIGTGSNSMIKHIALQQDGKIILTGSITAFNGNGSSRVVRLNTNGTFDNTFNVGTGASADIVVSSIQSDGKIIVAGSLYFFDGISRNYIARLNSDGSLDNNYAVCLGFNYEIHSISIQSDEKIIIGGYFNSFDGIRVHGVIRLNTNGTLDNSFNAGGSGGYIIYSTAIQPDGKIIIAGNFSSFNGVAVRGVARLNTDGTVDNTFNVGTGANNTVSTVLILPDGDILIGGNFSTYNGTSISGIARLNADGSLDNGFNIGTGATFGVNSIIRQPDDKIIIVGDFTNYNGTAINRIARLNTDGTLDNTFTVGTGANGSIRKIVLLSDNKLLIGGAFTSYNTTPYNRMARLNSNGTIDNTFSIGTGFAFSVNAILLQSDGKILVGGGFSTYNGLTQNRLIRLNVDGTKDPSFDIGTGANSSINTIAFQSDGRIIIGGSFSGYQDMAYNFIARLRGEYNPPAYNIIRGSIYSDENDDCVKQGTEKMIPSVVVKALPGPYYSGTDKDGNYEIKVDSGVATYTVTQTFNPLNSLFLINQCATQHTVSLSGTGQDVCCYDFADSIQDCGTALLNIEVIKGLYRRCWATPTYIHYNNLSNIPAFGIQIKVEYPPYIIPVSSTPMWNSRSGSILTYDLAVIADNYQGKINIIDSVICGDESIRGLTQCIKASITSSSCIPDNPAWDQSSLKITGSCVNDSATFILQNEGTGDMESNLPFRVYSNDTLIYTNTFLLNSGKQLQVKYPAEGNTIRMEADQHALHPGKSRPRAIVEACGGSSIDLRGLVHTTPTDDLNEDIAIDCDIIIDSYDPNDKQVRPSGIGMFNQIVPGQILNYTIRFQNTGTDTAFTVKIVDTLDIALDATSFIETGSSHSYDLRITGKGKAVLTFTFNNIKLPDSTTNLLASQGAVSFKIKVPESAPLGSTIKNKAAIYFDFNSPVITNETSQLVGIDVKEDLSKGINVVVEEEELVSGINRIDNNLFKLYPNPSTGEVTIETPYYNDQMELRIVSTLGIILKTIPLSKVCIQQINLDGVKVGTYLYEINYGEERKERGLLQLK